MLNQDVYDTALKFLSEPGTSPASDDYLGRAPYILAAVYREMDALDRAYRRANGLDGAIAPEGLLLPLADDFPLCDRLAPAAAYYLASSLVFDESIDLSDRLFNLYCRCSAAVRGEISAEVLPIRDVYG